MGDSSLLAYKYSITSCIITGFYTFYNAFLLIFLWIIFKVLLFPQEISKRQNFWLLKICHPTSSRLRVPPGYL